MSHSKEFSKFEESEYTEACAMTRFVVDIIIRLISFLLPVSVALTSFGFRYRQGELFALSAAVLVILGLIIWRTYRLVNGFLVSLLLAERKFRTPPNLGPFHLFALVSLPKSYRAKLDASISVMNQEVSETELPKLPPAHLGTPQWLVYGGLITLALSNVFMAGWYLLPAKTPRVGGSEPANVAKSPTSDKESRAMSETVVSHEPSLPKTQVEEFVADFNIAHLEKEITWFAISPWDEHALASIRSRATPISGSLGRVQSKHEAIALVFGNVSLPIGGFPKIGFEIGETFYFLVAETIPQADAASGFLVEKTSGVVKQFQPLPH